MDSTELGLRPGLDRPVRLDGGRRLAGLAAARTHRVAVPLGFFGLQLVLNLAWTGLFCALRRPGTAFAEIILLWAVILATLLAFGRASRWAALLMIPYLAWVAYAAALNFAIYRLIS